MDTIWLDELLLRLGWTSAQSVLLVAAILGIQRLWPRLPASARCTLWWLAALQLVIGLAWPRPLALPVLPATPAPQVAPLTGEPANRAASQADALRAAQRAVVAATALPALDNSAADSVAPARAAPAFPWRQMLAWLWLTGVVMTALQTLQAYQQSRRWRRQARPCTRADVLALYADVGDHLGLRSLPPLGISQAIASPQLLGPSQPIVLLPAAALDEFDANELRMALHHELSHHRRRDLWWGWIPALARHLFFFHPAAHIIAREYAFAREAACDEAVLATDHHAAHDYGRLLLRLGVAPRPCAGMAGASPTYTLLKRRLLMLQNHTATPRVLPLALIGGLVVLAALPWRVTARGTDAPAPAARAVAAPVAQAQAQPQPSPRVAPSARPQAITVAQASPQPAPRPAAKATTQTLTGTHLSSRGDGYAYVLMEGDHVTAAAEHDDFETARRARGNSNDAMLWVRKDNRAYLIRDAATVKQAQEIWAPVNALGEQQGKLGEQQGKLGSRQGDLGSQQGELGEKMGEIGRQHAQIALRQAARVMDDSSDADRERAQLDKQMSELDARQQALGQQMEALGQKQEALGSQQEVLGKQQAELGRRQTAASDRASAQMKQLIDRAIAEGRAQPAS